MRCSPQSRPEQSWEFLEIPGGHRIVTEPGEIQVFLAMGRLGISWEFPGGPRRGPGIPLAPKKSLLAPWTPDRAPGSASMAPGRIFWGARWIFISFGARQETLVSFEPERQTRGKLGRLGIY